MRQELHTKLSYLLFNAFLSLFKRIVGMKRIKGFTLIELLVVIAMLLAMLMPALRKAKFAAQAVTCRNNLKQIAMAVTLYAENNKEWLPRNGGRWMHLFMPYLGGPSDQESDFTKIGTYNCPSYPDKRQMLDYVVSSWLDGIDEAKDTKISEWLNPSSKVYLADNEDGPWRKIIESADDLVQAGAFDVWNDYHLPSGNDGLDYFDDSVAENQQARRVAKARHNKSGDINDEDKIGCNYMFIDGHADWISTADSTEKYWRPERM